MLIWGFAKVLFNIYGKKNLKLFNEGVDFLRDEDYEKALKVLRARLYKIEQEKQHNNIDVQKKSMVKNTNLTRMGTVL